MVMAILAMSWMNKADLQSLPSGIYIADGKKVVVK